MSQTKGETLVYLKLGEDGGLLGIVGQASGKLNIFNVCCVSSLVPLSYVPETQ